MRFLVIFLFLLVVSFNTAAVIDSNASAKVSVAKNASVSATLETLIKPDIRDLGRKSGKVVIPFITNVGQVDDEVAYYAKVTGGTAFITRDGQIIYDLRISAGRQGALVGKTNVNGSERLQKSRRWILHESIVGAKGGLKGDILSPGQVNIFKGRNQSEWYRRIPAYESLVITDAYPGIDVTLQARSQTIEKIFTVSPGKDASIIRMKMEGQTDTQVSEKGELLVSTASGEAKFTAPIAWQIDRGSRKQISVAWRLISKNEYGFEMGSYDRSLPLIIDPVFQSTYLGGSDHDFIQGMHISTSGDVYVWGMTNSDDFPGTSGGAQETNAGDINFGVGSGFGDIFIARLSDDLTTIQQATFLGGASDETSPVFLPAPDGSVYVGGETSSIDFPTTAGSVQPATTNPVVEVNGVSFISGDGFITHLSGDLTTVLQSTYLGGSSIDQVMQLAFSQTGGIYATGLTLSSDFPATSGGAQSSFGAGTGLSDVFVSLLSADLSSLSQSTYLGGGEPDGGGLILNSDYTPAGDGTGIYMFGQTPSDDFPGTAGGDQAVYGGGSAFGDLNHPGVGRAGDFYLAKFSNDLKTLIQSTYIGGSGNEASDIGTDFGKALIKGDSIYVFGRSASLDFPGMSNGIRSTGDGGVISRVSSDLTSIIQSTYLGGDIHDIAISSSGDIFTCGTPLNDVLPGPAGGAQEFGSVGSSLLITRITADLRSIIQATFLGGDGVTNLACGAIALSPDGSIYVSSFVNGPAGAPGFPELVGGIQEVSGGGGDTLITHFSSDLKAITEATFLGGASEDSGALYTDNQRQLQIRNGRLYVWGDTKSAPFPGTAGGAQPLFGGAGSLGGDSVITWLPVNLRANSGGTGGGGTSGGTAGPLVASILPTSRSVQLGTTATAFATIINAGTTAATACGISPTTVVPASFSYQTTNPATNALAGSPDTPVDIPARGFQTYLFQFNPASAFPATSVQLAFACSNASPAGVLTGVNTFNLSASTTPVPDIIALAATVSGDGIVHIPGATGAAAFAVATFNVGSSGTVTVAADTRGISLPVALSICETNPGDGTCLSPPASSVTAIIGAGATPTFSIFATGMGSVPTDPAKNRIFVRFEEMGNGRGSTSVAVSTQ